MGFTVDTTVPVITVFLQGLVSFFSPCVLPLIPLYIGYLSGGTGVMNEEGEMQYKRSKVMLNTLFFVIGISFAFFLLGFGFSTLGQFFNSNQALFARIGGVIVFLFGLYQLGVFGKTGVLGKDHRLPFQLDKMAMSPLAALLMGFTFSFAWTPCVGPALASVLLMASSAGSRTVGLLLIGVYTIGFVLPFLAVGLFTTSVLAFFKKNQNIVKYTVKIGGILLLIMGLLMFTGKMNAVTNYLSNISQQNENQENEQINKQEDKQENAEGSKEAGDEKENDPVEELMPAMDFTLTDQYGNTHTLSDYKGKTVLLNFWATWCPPCRAEMPDIQALYETYDTEGEDALIILGIAGPNHGKEQAEEGIIEFLEENGYTYPVLMDLTGEVFGEYQVYSLPTTFMIDRDGNLFGYVSGQLSEDVFKNIIQQTMDAKK